MESSQIQRVVKSEVRGRRVKSRVKSGDGE